MRSPGLLKIGSWKTNALLPTRERDLQAHLRICTSCPAIAESNLALHSTRMIRPAEGFAARFQVRLIENRKTARTRQFIGTLILILAGLAFLYWLANPVIQAAMRSPAEWITNRGRIFAFYTHFYTNV